jgi:membrane protein required for colicin V production
LAPMFGNEAPWNRCVAMLVIYAVTALVIWVLSCLVRGLIERVQLKEFDRQLGAILGAVKGIVWCAVITFFAVTVMGSVEPVRQMVLKSRSGYCIAVLTERTVPLLPQDVRDVLGKYIEELDRGLDYKPAAEQGGQGGEKAKNAPEKPSQTPESTGPKPGPATGSKKVNHS